MSTCDACEHRHAEADPCIVCTSCEQWSEETEKLRAQLAKAKEALEFYAHWENLTENGKPRQAVVSAILKGDG